jgi:hypothetical protein
MVVGTKHPQFEGMYEAPGWNVVRTVVMMAAMCTVIGCSFSGDRKEAEQLAEQYFAKMQGGDNEGVLALYSARFYEATSRADWLAILESQRARCGTPKPMRWFHGMCLVHLERIRVSVRPLCTMSNTRAVECRRR